MRPELEDVLSAPRAHFWFGVGVISFVTNWAWEMAQMRAYATLADRPWHSTILPCSAAALADAGLTLALCGVSILLARARLPLLASSALLGAVAAVVIEKVELARGSWSYTEDMPIVPIIRVGLWPFLQLTVLVPISIGLALRWKWYRTTRTR